MEALILVMKNLALRGNQRAAQMLLNLTRDLDLLRPKQAFNPPEIHMHFPEPPEKSTNGGALWKGVQPDK